MLRVLTLQEAEAAERAKIDIVSIPPSLMLDPQYRDAAPSLFSMPGETFWEQLTTIYAGRFTYTKMEQMRSIAVPVLPLSNGWLTNQYQ